MCSPLELLLAHGGQKMHFEKENIQIPIDKQPGSRPVPFDPLAPGSFDFSFLPFAAALAAFCSTVQALAQALAEALAQALASVLSQGLPQ